MAERYFINFFMWVYSSMFYGRGAILYTTIIIISAVWVFIRWRLIGLSALLYTGALLSAYLGGFIMFWRG